MKELVAVYGSLREDQYNHPVMGTAGGTFKGLYWTQPKYTMYSLDQYPAVCPGGGDSVCLEVYEVEDLNPIDVLEGHPDYYYRVQIDTPFGEAWLYLMNENTIPDYTEVVPGGDWVKFRQERVVIGGYL